MLPNYHFDCYFISLQVLVIPNFFSVCNTEEDVVSVLPCVEWPQFSKVSEPLVGECQGQLATAPCLKSGTIRQDEPGIYRVPPVFSGSWVQTPKTWKQVTAESIFKSSHSRGCESFKAHWRLLVRITEGCAAQNIHVKQREPWKGQAIKWFLSN